MPRKGSAKEMLTNEHINRWYNNTVRGSEVTRDVYLRRLRAICKWAGKDPMEMVGMNEGDLYNLICDFITHEEKRGMAGSYIESSVKALKSWLIHNGIKINRDIKIKGKNQTPSLVDERVPTQAELKRVFLSGTPRDRVACVLMAHCGFRPEVLGNYRSDDGLVVGDFPEMHIKGNEVVFDKIPTVVVVRENLSKTKLRYFSFLSEEGCLYLKEFLEQRLRSGEKLDAKSDIITSRNVDKKFVRSVNVGGAIRNCLRKAGIQSRPYVLRCYCDTQLLMGESKGKIVFSFRQFVMGHRGSIENRYTVNKSKLPEDLVEDMRESYKRCQPYLVTYTMEDDEQRTEIFRKQLLSIIGVDADEINQMNIMDMSNNDIMEELRKKLGEQMTKNGNGQKVIDPDEVEKYIEDGWEFVASLPTGKVIVKLPLSSFKLQPNGNLG